MSLSRIFYADLDSKELVKSFDNSTNITAPVFYQGDKSNIDIILLQATGNSAKPYVNHTITTETLTIGIGRIDKKVTGGTYKLIYDGDTTTSLSFDASAATVQTALNALASITSAGGVTVTGLDPFKVFFNTVGACDYIEADVTTISPASTFQNTRIQTGDVSTKEIQVIRVRESLVAVTNTFTAIPAPTISVTRDVTGGSGLNDVQRLEISQICQGGSVTLTFGGDSTSFEYGATDADVLVLFEALPGIGVGNITVTKINDLIYQFTFVGTLADATQALISANASGLLGFSGFRGLFDLRSYAVDELLDGATSTDSGVFFEGELSISGDKTTIFRAQCVINNDAINDATTSPPLAGSIDWTTTVFGPASAVDENLVIFDGVTGKLIKDSGINKTVIDGHSTKLAHITVTQAVDLDTIESDVSASKTKTDFITVTQAVDLDTIEIDVALNNAKVTNATHTGDVTGGTVLTLSSTAITGQSTVTPVSGDFVLISDTSDSGNLKKVDVADLLGGGGGGILPSSTSTKTADYTVLIGDVKTRIILGSATVADRIFTLDVSLLADFSENISFENKSDHRLKIVVSNTGTMTINDSMIDLFLWKGDGILTLTGDTATNCTTVAGF